MLLFGMKTGDFKMVAYISSTFYICIWLVGKTSSLRRTN